MKPPTSVSRIIEERPFQSDRTFLLWKSSVSHGQLLLRSPADHKHSTNIDIYFKDVSYMEVSAYFDGLSIEEPTLEEKQKAKEKLGRRVSLDSKSFILCSQGQRYLIVAPILVIKENNLEANESEIYGI